MRFAAGIKVSAVPLMLNGKLSVSCTLKKISSIKNIYKSVLRLIDYIFIW